MCVCVCLCVCACVCFPLRVGLRVHIFFFGVDPAHDLLLGRRSFFFLVGVFVCFRQLEDALSSTDTRLFFVFVYLFIYFPGLWVLQRAPKSSESYGRANGNGYAVLNRTRGLFFLFFIFFPGICVLQRAR